MEFVGGFLRSGAKKAVIHGVEEEVDHTVVTSVEQTLLDDAATSVQKASSKEAEAQAARDAAAQALKEAGEDGSTELAEDLAEKESELAEATAAKKAAEADVVKVNKQITARVQADTISKMNKEALDAMENKIANLQETLEKKVEPSGSKLKDFRNLILITWLGYSVMVIFATDSPEACAVKCACEKDPCRPPGTGSGTGVDGLQDSCKTVKPLPCETKATCDDYCDKACTDEQRTLRAQCYVQNHPLDAALNTLSGVVNTGANAPSMIWAYLKWVILGVIVLFGIPIIYKIYSGVKVGIDEGASDYGKNKVKGIFGSPKK